MYSTSDRLSKVLLLDFCFSSREVLHAESPFKQQALKKAMIFSAPGLDTCATQIYTPLVTCQQYFLAYNIQAFSPPPPGF